MRRNVVSAGFACAAVLMLVAVTATLGVFPPAAVAAAPFIQDSFSRTVASGLGSAPTGGEYTQPQAAGWRVDGSQAVVSLAASTGRSSLVGSSSIPDVDATTTFGLSALPTAGSAYVGQQLRTSSAGAFYSPRLRVMPNKAVYLGLRYVNASGAATSVGRDVTLGFQASAASRDVLRSQIEGGTLRTKAWLKGSAEPPTWQVTATVAQLPNPGRFGLWSYLGTGANSLNVLIDYLAVSSLAALPEPTPTPTLTKTPTPTPTSTPTPTPTKAMPGPSNSGVPAGTKLTVHTGDLTITTAGSLIDGLDIRGYVVVKAPNVTIRRSIIRGGPVGTVNRGMLAITQPGAGNFLVEDVTIVPSNPSPYINGINVNQPGIIRRADISGTVDGMMIYGSGVRIEGSYLHDFAHYTKDPNWGGGPSHDDAIQVQSGTGIQIVGNSLSGAYNAAVMVTQDVAATSNLAINSNWIDQGGCSINFGSDGAYKSGMQVNGNRFGRAQRVVGCAIVHNSSKSDLAPVGNVWDDTGQAITINRGT